MYKKILASLMLAMLILAFVVPVRTAAAPKWWGRFKEIVIADAEGALSGFVLTESLGGAIAGGIMGSIQAAVDGGVPVGEWRPQEEARESIGLHHNLGLSHLSRDKSTPWLWEPKTQDTIWPDTWLAIVQESVNGYLASAGIAVGRERAEPLDRSPYVSENFTANLTKALAILEEESDHPQDLLNRAIALILNEALKVTDPELREEIVSKAQDYNSSRSNKAGGVIDLGGPGSPLEFGKIEITYQQQKMSGQPVDIVLAWIFADVLQQSSIYWSDVYCWGDNMGSRDAAGNGDDLWCWGANFADVVIRSSDKGTPLDKMDIIVVVPARSGMIAMTIGSPLAKVGDREVVLDVPPLIRGGRTMVPFRFIGETLGARIDWIQESLTVTYLRETREGPIAIEMVIGSNRALVNGVSVPIDSTNPSIVPQIVNGRTLVPVRFISETLGFEVGWDQENGVVSIEEQPR